MVTEARQIGEKVLVAVGPEGTEAIVKRAPDGLTFEHSKHIPQGTAGLRPGTRCSAAPP